MMETRTIERFPDYQFLADGTVLGKSGVPLRPYPSGNYRAVALHVNGARFQVYVHHLICEAFHGPRPKGLIVLHEDDDPYNCRADNLRWGTYSENNRMSARRGKTGRPLPTAEADRIVALAEQGIGQVAIAREVGCSQSTVSNTLRRHREALASSLN